MEAVEQPWLNKEDIFDGKPRFVNIEAESGKVRYDRKHKTGSKISENSTSENDVHWKRPTKSSCDKRQILMEMLCDFNSHLLVTLGNDRLEESEALKHLNIYRAYIKRKEEKLIKAMEKSKAKKAKKTVEKLEATNGGSEQSSSPLEVCQICNNSYERVEDHLLLTHYKSRILDEYPSSNFKCFFAKCSFVTIPGSQNYIRHIGIEHEVLKSFLNEQNGAENETMPVKIQDPLSSPLQVKFKFQCPLCSKGDISEPRTHLAHHFCNKVKQDFPFIKEKDGYLCPIEDCSSVPLKSAAKLAQHINLDHDQLNVYLQEENIVGHFLPERKSKKRKRPSSDENLETLAKRKK